MLNTTTTRDSDSFESDRSIERDVLVARLRGMADMTALDALDTLVTAVHRDAKAASVRRVEVDFRELEFMNSSCFKCFVTWIGTVQDLPRAEQYGIVFKSNPRFHWQRRSLNALRCFALDIVSVES